MDDNGFPYDPEALCGTVAELAALRGQAREVAILTFSDVYVEQEGYDNWNNGTYSWAFNLRLPAAVYVQFTRKDIEQCQETLNDTLKEVIIDDNNCMRFLIGVAVKPRQDWREIALQWLKGEGINNQGRVRSDNIAVREEDGLLFRSQPEILLYHALKDQGVTFAPLPVFLRGGQSYQRIEPDFVIIKNKLMMIVEVDGDTVHRETPAEADKRTRLFKYEGASVEHVAASECDTLDKAKECVKRLMILLQRLSSR